MIPGEPPSGFVSSNVTTIGPLSLTAIPLKSVTFQKIRFYIQSNGNTCNQNKQIETFNL